VGAFTLPRERNIHLFPRGRKLMFKARGGEGGTIWGSTLLLNRMFLKDRKSSIESGIETALFLLDKTEQVEWKKDICKQFPWVPNTILDQCLDSITHAFSTVTPSELKAALKPGGLVKVRPKLENSIVKALEKQPINNSMIPLKEDQKRQLLKYLVTLSLDYLLKDAETLLANPFDKLRELDVERRRIQRRMSFWQLCWYQIRFHRIRTSMMIGLATVGTSYAFYLQDTTIVSTAILNAFSKFSVSCSIVLQKFNAFVATLVLFVTTIDTELSSFFTRVTSGRSLLDFTAKNSKKGRR